MQRAGGVCSCRRINSRGRLAAVLHPALALAAGAALTLPGAGLAQTYVDTVQTLEGSTTLTSPAIILGGYNKVGDGGGGSLANIGACNTPDRVRVFKTAGGGGGGVGSTCYLRTEPISSVAQGGARCDVRIIDQGEVDFVPATDTTKAYIIAKQDLFPPNFDTQFPNFIAISQVGGPTVFNSGGSRIARYATRASTVQTPAGAQSYKSGDLISFVSGSSTQPGSFAQQIAILVDTVDGSGHIADWHFLHGGLYDARDMPPTSPDMAQDDTHSATNGHGATFHPVWSGWSVLDKQNFNPDPDGGSGYSVNNRLTLESSDPVILALRR